MACHYTLYTVVEPDKNMQQCRDQQAHPLASSMISDANLQRDVHLQASRMGSQWFLMSMEQILHLEHWKIVDEEEAIFDAPPRRVLKSW